MKLSIFIILFILNLNAFEVQEAENYERVFPNGKDLHKIISFNTYLDNVVSSVVTIQITKGNYDKPVGAGSGVIISKDGYIVTNAHVIKDSKNVYVYLKDSKKRKKAKVIGFDRPNDIAVIKIKSSKLKAIKFVDSDTIKLSDLVFSVGNGFGLGTTVSMGIISALNKRSLGIYEYENLIQTDATINPGNSGGALVNNRGDLIGINSALYTRSGGSNGVGFAIPSNTVKIIASSIIAHGKFERGYFGASFDLKNEDNIIIDSIDTQSPAYKSGLRKSDTIIRINGKVIDEIGDVVYILGLKTPLTKISVTYLRNGKKKKTLVVLGKRKK